MNIYLIFKESYIFKQKSIIMEGFILCWNLSSTLALSPLAVSINTRLYSLYHHQCISPSPSPASSSSSPQSPPLSSYYPAAHFSGDWVFIREVFVYHSRKTLQLIEDFEPFIEERVAWHRFLWHIYLMNWRFSQLIQRRTGLLFRANRNLWSALILFFAFNNKHVYRLEVQSVTIDDDEAD